MLLISCGPAPTTEVGTTVLDEFSTFISHEDEVMAVPSVLRWDGSHLFVFDKGNGEIVELDGSGTEIHRYGRRGRGPGEFQQVSNLFATDDRIHAVDHGQLLIHTYERGGEALAPMHYGEISGRGSVPGAPFSYSAVYPEDVVGKPVVTRSGRILASPRAAEEPADWIYGLHEWNGTFVAGIGAVPEGGTFVLDNDLFRENVENREIPAYYRTHAFAVESGAEDGVFYVVYPAFPRIAKVTDEGDVLWERDIDPANDFSDISDDFFETMDRMMREDPRFRVLLRYYASGISGPDGDLFLITQDKPFAIHQYSSSGDLVHRFEFASESESESESVDIIPEFDIDFRGRRIFVVSNEGEVRVYPF